LLFPFYTNLSPEYSSAADGARSSRTNAPWHALVRATQRIALRRRRLRLAPVHDVLCARHRSLLLRSTPPAAPYSFRHLSTPCSTPPRFAPLFAQHPCRAPSTLHCGVQPRLSHRAASRGHDLRHAVRRLSAHVAARSPSPPCTCCAPPRSSVRVLADKRFCAAAPQPRQQLERVGSGLLSPATAVPTCHVKCCGQRTDV
jgi:hypothetical protein